MQPALYSSVLTCRLCSRVLGAGLEAVHAQPRQALVHQAQAEGHGAAGAAGAARAQADAARQRRRGHGGAQAVQQAQVEAAVPDRVGLQGRIGKERYSPSLEMIAASKRCKYWGRSV